MIKHKKNDKQIADILNNCFEKMLAGDESIESCLASYLEQASKLKPLLETIQAARAASNLSPEPSFRARARYEFRSALYDSMSAKKRTALSWRWRWATIASTTGVLILTSAGGSMAASSGSMPGQAFYQVKRTIENVQLTMTPSQAAKARLYATLADRRISEIVYAAEQLEDVKLIEDLTQQLTQDLSNVSASITPGRTLIFGDSSKQAGAPSLAGLSPEQSTINSNTLGDVTSTAVSTVPPFTTTTPTPAITITSALVSPAVSVPQVTLGQAPQPTIAPPIALPQTSLSGITDPALLKLLQQYSVRNIAELMSILDKVSPSVKAALLAAIQAATSGYGQILGL